MGVTSLTMKLVTELDNLRCSFELALCFFDCLKHAGSVGCVDLSFSDDLTSLGSTAYAQEISLNSFQWCKCKHFKRLLVLPNLADTSLEHSLHFRLL